MRQNWETLCSMPFSEFGCRTLAVESGRPAGSSGLWRWDAFSQGSAKAKLNRVSQFNPHIAVQY
jgi:hypothetical protein